MRVSQSHSREWCWPGLRVVQGQGAKAGKEESVKEKAVVEEAIGKEDEVEFSEVLIGWSSLAVGCWREEGLNVLLCSHHYLQGGRGGEVCLGFVDGEASRDWNFEKDVGMAREWVVEESVFSWHGASRTWRFSFRLVCLHAS